MAAIQIAVSWTSAATAGAAQAPARLAALTIRVAKSGLSGTGNETYVSRPPPAAAIGFRREASVRQEPDVERGQREFLTAPCIGPAESLRDCDVDRQGAHVGGNVAAHGRMLSLRAGTGYAAAYRTSFAAMRRLQ